MRISFILLAIVEIIASVLFFMNEASDIQLGFAITFLFMALSSAIVGFNIK